MVMGVMSKSEGPPAPPGGFPGGGPPGGAPLPLTIGSSWAVSCGASLTVTALSQVQNRQPGWAANIALHMTDTTWNTPDRNPASRHPSDAAAEFQFTK